MGRREEEKKKRSRREIWAVLGGASAYPIGYASVTATFTMSGYTRPRTSLDCIYSSLTPAPTLLRVILAWRRSTLVVHLPLTRLASFRSKPLAGQGHASFLSFHSLFFAISPHDASSNLDELEEEERGGEQLQHRETHLVESSRTFVEFRVIFLKRRREKGRNEKEKKFEEHKVEKRGLSLALLRLREL